MGAKRKGSSSGSSELVPLVEELALEIPDHLKGPAVRVLRSLEDDVFEPRKEDLAILLSYLLIRERSRKEEAKKKAAPKDSPSEKPLVLDRVPPAIDQRPRPRGRPASQPSGRRGLEPAPPEREGPVRSAFHDRIQEEDESEASRTVRRRLGWNSKG